MPNQHYLNRYNKFIHAIRLQGNRSLEYSEIHHIVPQCLGGNNSIDNKITLTLREHFLAHWLLFNAHFGTYNIMSAFYQMCNKNPKNEFKRKTLKFSHGILSRVYEKKKKQLYALITELNTGKVTVTDVATGEKVRINTNEFDRSLYQHSNLGKLWVTEISSGNKIQISPDEYNKTIHSFHTTGKVVCLDTNENKMVSIPVQEYHANKNRYLRPAGTYEFTDVDTQNIVLLTKPVASNINKQLGYKKYKQKVNSMISCIDSLGNLTTIPVAEYNPEIHTHYNHNSFVVFDLTSNKHITTTIDQYNPAIHITNTTGMVVSRDSRGNSCLVSKEQFAAGEYTGVTKGLTTVKNIETGEFQQITLDEFNLNKSKYKGPCYQKINVINISTGVRSQLPKTEFNPEIHVSLGKNNQYFLAKNKLTAKTRNVSIYEWNKTIHETEWDIVDLETFNKRKKLL